MRVMEGEEVGTELDEGERERWGGECSKKQISYENGDR